MGIITDVIQGIPTNPILREQLRLSEMQRSISEAKVTALETEVSHLKNENAALKAANAQSKNKIEELQRIIEEFRSPQVSPCFSNTPRFQQQDGV